MDFRSSILPHRDRLYRLALSITADAAEAEDVVQDTMLRAWERRDEWATVQNLQAWLMQICRNLSLDHLKRRKYQPQRLSDSGDDGAGSKLKETAAPLSDGVEKSVESREALNLMSQLISQLPPPLNDLVFLRDIEGLSYSEIADQLHLTEDQVRVYLHRARSRLRESYMAIQRYGL